MVTPDAEWLEVTRIDHNLGKIHDVGDARPSTPALRRRRQDQAKGGARLSTSPARPSARPAWARTSPTSSSPASPACRRKAATASSPPRASSCTACRRRSRTVCLEFFGQVREAVPAIVEIKRYLDDRPARRDAGRPRASRRALLKAVGYATKAKRHGLPEDGAARRHRRRRRERRRAGRLARSCGIANARGGEGFVAVSAETREELLARPLAHRRHRRHTNAFKINEDVVIPLPRLGDYTDGVERINIELSHRQQAAPRRRPARVLPASPLPDAADEVRVAEDTRRRARSRRRWSSSPLPAPQLARPPRRASTQTVPVPCRTIPCVVSWKKELKARAGRDLRRHRLRRTFAIATSAIHHRRCCEAASSSPCTCTPATATCTPTSRSTPTTTRCSRQANAVGGADHGLARQLGGVISGEHGIGITKLEFLTAEEIAPFADYKARVDPAGALQQGQAARRRRTSPTPTRRASA